MTRQIMRRVSWPIVFAGLAAPFLTNCGGLPKVPGLPGNCPDMNVDAIDKFDFATNFKLKAPDALKVKAGLGAALNMKALADRLDADLLTACGGLAKDLGDTATYANGQDACNGAIKILGDTKAKLGAGATLSLDAAPPVCGLDVSAYGSCAAGCDPTVKPGSVEATCEGGSMSGTCTDKCTGACNLSAAAACSGECDGTCDANVTATCSGNCKGKCDGKATPAAGAKCSGTCAGTCDASIKGTCSGKCGGSCQLKTAGSCSGSCSGTCSVKMTAPKCTGTVKPPTMSADCQAKCNAQVQANATCTPPHVGIKITGAADAGAATKLQAALEKNLPLILNVAVGMAKNVGAVAGSVKTVIEGAQTIVTASPTLALCVASPFKGAIDAVTGINASVSVSVKVQGSASGGGGSGSASASGSAKAGG